MAPKVSFLCSNTLIGGESKALCGLRVEPTFPTERRQVLSWDPQNKIRYPHSTAMKPHTLQLYSNKAFLILCSFICRDFNFFSCKMALWPLAKGLVAKMFLANSLW